MNTLSIDAQKQAIDSEEEVSRRTKMFLRTKDGENLQNRLKKGAIDEIGYNQEFNILFSAFLKKFDLVNKVA